MEIKCSFCKKAITVEDNYCPYCGYKIKEEEDIPIITSEESVTTPKPEVKQASIPIETEQEKKPKEPEPKVAPKEETKPEKIPEEIIEQYYIRVKIKQYDKKLKDHKEKIDTFLSELNEEELEEIKDEIPKLKEAINRLKQRRKELLAEKKPLPHEDLLEERKKIRKQISNLKNKFHLKEIEPHVYEKLRSEYDTKLKKLNEKLKDKYYFEENWQKLLKKDIEKQEEQLRILEGRLKVGELSKKAYENKINEVNEQIEKLSLLLSELKL
ncbi:MAG: zinc ribbon domain-containing protein [Candidatus Helarchaeota archaeon]|nr:zinc ribbon domain-containing protein [Candidatus Helarchaeota archaeon]